MDTQPRNAYDVLAERGFVYHVTDERGLRAALSQRATIYCGFDPTAGSLTIGHLLQIMALRHLQQHGHRTIAVVGGGTGLVGDPSGKSEARPLLSQADIAANVAVVRQQLADYVGAGQGEFVIVDNATWLHELNHISFLRDVGRHFNINEMLASETYRTRLDTTGLSYLELSYRPLQGYDFLHLHRTYNCICQIGGSDQWSNILAGVDLIRRAERQRVFGMVTPLITTASGAKMGKTESGAIWLDPELTSPYEFYQFWMNVDDADVEGLLALYTFLPLDRVRELGRFEGSDIRQAKEVLAYEATQTVHGPAAAMEARAAARALFGASDRVPEAALEAMPTTTVDLQMLEDGIPVANLLAAAGLTASRTEARRLIQQGGAYVNEERVDSIEAAVDIDDLVDGQILLRAGKKRYHRLEIGPDGRA